jgi:hypothetical protein
MTTSSNDINMHPVATMSVSKGTDIIVTDIFVIGNGRMVKSLIVECLEYLPLTSIANLVSVGRAYSSAIKRYLHDITRLEVEPPQIVMIPLLQMCHQLQSLTVIDNESNDAKLALMSPSVVITAAILHLHSLTSLNLQQLSFAENEQSALIQLLILKSMSYFP